MQSTYNFQASQWASFRRYSDLPLHRRLKEPRASRINGSGSFQKPGRTPPWRACRITALADSGAESILTVAGRKGSALLYSRHDRDIFNLAVPALFSILLDPLMSLTDTGPMPSVVLMLCSIQSFYSLQACTSPFSCRHLFNDSHI